MTTVIYFELQESYISCSDKNRMVANKLRKHF
jgi:hypothetical protein